MRIIEERENTEITLEEIDEAISKVKTGKAAGIDGITPEMIKYIEQGKETLKNLFCQIMRQQKLPQKWNTGNILPM